ncbi:hypothetical protein BKH41_08535 [Helicobacter sp. 12S02232-10]|nr:hypothetical protein BKH41_08535 [Helicobacter sp. 12S02232-10]
MSNTYKDIQDAQIKMMEDYILSHLDTGLKWQKNWEVPTLNIPHNPATGTKYKRTNGLILMLYRSKYGYQSNQWATFAQIKEMGGSVQAGEKSVPFIWKYALTPEEALKRKMITPSDPRINDAVVFFNKKMLLFNIEQSTLTQEMIKDYQIKHNFPKHYYESDKETTAMIESKLHKDIEAVLKNSKIPIIDNIGSPRAFYDPQKDEITLPDKKYFDSLDSYYSTALHELGHSTGHPNRLNREMAGFSTDKISYAKEEFRAELYSVLQGLELGLEVNLKNHAGYIDNWKNVFKNEETQREEIKKALKDSVSMVKYVQENWYPDHLKQEFRVEKQAQNEDVKENKINPPFEIREIKTRISEIQKVLSNPSLKDKTTALKELEKIAKQPLTQFERQAIQRLQNQHQCKGLRI